ncbi:MAG: hypothetical protein ABL958_13445 [Bdellovibrionia bacterium]
MKQVENFDDGLAHNLVHDQSDWEILKEFDSGPYEIPLEHFEDMPEEISIDDGITEKFDIEKIIKGDVGVEARSRSRHDHPIHDLQEMRNQDKSRREAPADQSREEILSGLRERLRKFAPDRGSFPFSWIQGGLPRGALVHVLGTKGGGKTELMLKFLAENQDVKVAWIEDLFTAYPVSFGQMGSGLDRILFVSAARDAFWAFSQIVNSQYFDVVVLSSANLKLNEKELRRWQLMAEQSKSCCILISENENLTAGRDWAVSMKLEVDRMSLDGPPRLQILKTKSVSVTNS